MNQTSTPAARAAFYRMIWRWHFYAGLFVVPMVLVLALTGAAYLFKPQVERWEERAYQGMGVAGQVSPDVQVKAALTALPGAMFHSYRLPQAEGDAVLVHLGLPGGARAMRDVFVSPQGKVVGVLDPETRIMAVVHDLHGQLLLGHRGSWLVELAASWAIVMILSGLYLWWPRGSGGGLAGGGLAGIVWPRLGRGSKVAWRDLHAVTGFWVAGLAMVLLLTGLPWADVWGSAFKAVRAEMGWVKGKQDWTIGGRAPDGAPAESAPAESAPAGDDHAEHDHAAMMAAAGADQGGADQGGMDHAAMDHGQMQHGRMAHAMSPVTLSEVVARGKAERLPFPTVVTPPGAPGRFGAKAAPVWTVRSDTQNRPQRVTITFDRQTGQQASREVFADKHVIDRVVGYGVAWHEGQLFGWVNQLIGVLTALMLAMLSVTGFVLWRRRKPDGVLGAPPLPAVPARMGGVAIIVLLLAAFLPLLAISLVAMLLLERLVFRRIPALRGWLGLPS